MTYHIHQQGSSRSGAVAKDLHHYTNVLKNKTHTSRLFMKKVRCRNSCEFRCRPSPHANACRCVDSFFSVDAHLFLDGKDLDYRRKTATFFMREGPRAAVVGGAVLLCHNSPHHRSRQEKESSLSRHTHAHAAVQVRGLCAVRACACVLCAPVNE